jgi:hypothetical protein
MVAMMAHQMVVQWVREKGRYWASNLVQRLVEMSVVWMVPLKPRVWRKDHQKDRSLALHLVNRMDESMGQQI